MTPLVNTSLHLDNALMIALMESWPARLAAYMEKKGVLQRDLARMIGMTQAGVSHWFRGTSNINLVDFMRLCACAGANPSAILFGCEPSSQDLQSNIHKLLQDAPKTDLFKWRIPKVKRKRRSKLKKTLDLENHGEYSDTYSVIGGDK